MAWEIFETLPEPDVILVPIGLGSGVCARASLRRARRPQTEIIGVQAEGADSVVRSWRSGSYQETAEARTWAEGMATRRPAEMTLDIMQQVMDDAVLVSDDELRRACRLILEQTHNLAEGAGAASLAAAWKERQRLAGKTVVGILSGGNLDLSQLPEFWRRPEASISESGLRRRSENHIVDGVDCQRFRFVGIGIGDVGRVVAGCPAGRLAAIGTGAE